MISVLEHGPFLVDHQRATLSHGGDKLKFAGGGVGTDCDQNLLLKVREGIGAAFPLPQILLCPGPNILLWIQVGRIFGPIGEDLDVGRLKGCLGSWSVKEPFPIQQNCVRSQVGKSLFHERGNPLFHFLGPDFCGPRLRNKKSEGLPIGCCDRENFLLLSLSIGFLREPPLRADESRQPLLSLRHVCPRGAQLRKFGFQFFGVPGEFFDVTNPLQGIFPLLGGPIAVLLPKAFASLAQFNAWVTLVDLPFRRVTFVRQPANDSAPTHLPLQLFR